MDEQIIKAKQYSNQLTDIDFNVDDILVNAEENKETAAEIKSEAYWYNKKLQIIMIGSVILLAAIVSLWLLNLDRK